MSVPAGAAAILRAGRSVVPPVSFGRLAAQIGCSDLTAKRWANHLGLDITTHRVNGAGTSGHPVWDFPGASDLAQRLWLDADYTTAAIALELVKLTGTHIGANAVIGWAHRKFWPPKATRRFVRFGKTGPRSPEPVPPKQASAAVVRAKARDRIEQEEAVVGLFDDPEREVEIRRATRAANAPLPVPGYRSPHRECQWFDGHRGSFLRCDDAAMPGRSFCELHCERVYVGKPIVRVADAA